MTGTAAAGNQPTTGETVTIQGPQREPFMTIDDAIALAERLLTCLRTLVQYRHPLEIRKGKGVISMAAAESEESRQIRAGSRTYFVDLVQTKEGKPYLRITESRYKGDDKGHERSSLMVFPEDAEAFAGALNEMISRLAETENG